MKLTPQAAGTFAIAPTPFHDDGRLDDASIDRLTDFYAETGCDGITVLGIMGEAHKLEAAEAEAQEAQGAGLGDGGCGQAGIGDCPNAQRGIPIYQMYVEFDEFGGPSNPPLDGGNIDLKVK